MPAAHVVLADLLRPVTDDSLSGLPGGERSKSFCCVPSQVAVIWTRARSAPD